MKILIGLKEEKASGSTQDSYGYGGFSISATSTTILAAGTEKELFKIIEKAKHDINLAKEIDLDIDEDSEISEKEYDKLVAKHRKLNAFAQYDTVMMVEGEIFNLKQ